MSEEFIPFPKEIMSRIAAMNKEIQSLIEGWALGREIDPSEYEMVDNGFRKIVSGDSKDEQ